MYLAKKLSLLSFSLAMFAICEASMQDSASGLACEQALHLGNIVKSRCMRGDAKAGGVLARLASLARVKELARGLLQDKLSSKPFCALPRSHRINSPE